MPRKPPEAKNPAEDCRRVLRVSSGKRERSTVVPARAPARRAVWKGGGGWDFVAVMVGEVSGEAGREVVCLVVAEGSWSRWFGFWEARWDRSGGGLVGYL